MNAECDYRVTDKQELLELEINRAHTAYDNAVCRLVGKYSMNGLNERAQSVLRALGSVVEMAHEEPFRIRPLIGSIDSILQQIPLNARERKLAEQKKRKFLQAYAQRLEEGEAPFGMIPREASELAEEFSGLAKR